VKSAPKSVAKRRQAGKSRKPYRSPRFVAYGDVRRLTDAVDVAGNADGGGGYTVKT
jgi:hypothetical protein